MAWYEAAALGYMAVGVYKFGLCVPALKFSVAYSLYKQPKDRETLSYILIYLISSIFVAVFMWPVLVRHEGWSFFRTYTTEEIREAIDEVYGTGHKDD